MQVFFSDGADIRFSNCITFAFLAAFSLGFAASGSATASASSSASGLGLRLGIGTAWILGRTPPAGMMTFASSLPSSSSLRMASWMKKC